ncbi:hypothetical protein BO79DRAFT_21166 [Aspergillus costaricaensis CBS 115574]|uniref:Uncharacterized protein n=1 Tax=Aspergillus costaricaensis CBS 115574 TaxID=1448317 RepID=A0ACD1ICG9_9EURO|nr:hypothetical protein BO79DRAFT_21166 [Aspergillus costaricaensis CBS 115574]RAK88112.1 hypothetical protein BO79DRAFT_21166 [Aspergillus costaricaensis CBS 115574]
MDMVFLLFLLLLLFQLSPPSPHAKCPSDKKVSKSLKMPPEIIFSAATSSSLIILNSYPSFLGGFLSRLDWMEGGWGRYQWSSSYLVTATVINSSTTIEIYLITAH